MTEKSEDQVSWICHHQFVKSINADDYIRASNEGTEDILIDNAKKQCRLCGIYQ